MKNMNRTKKLTVSGMVMAIYIVMMLLTQSAAFGQYQVRIATAIYSTAYLFPFLVVPLSLSNLLSNMLMGGLGFFDVVGGGAVGLLTAGCCALIRKCGWNESLVAMPIALIPSFGVAIWLSALLQVPYPIMAGSLLVGQTMCGIFAVLLVKALKRALKMKEEVK